MKQKIAIIIFLIAGILSAESRIGKGSMVAGGGFNLSGIGTGLIGNFEYGLTETLGIMASAGNQTYTTGSYDFTFTPIDLWVTYHSDAFKKGMLANFDDIDMFIMGGATITSYKWETSGSDDTDSSVAFGFGTGFRKPLKGKLSLYGEGRYRLAKFKYGSSLELTTLWYSIAGGITYTF